MSGDFADTIRAEIAELEVTLADNPTYRKIKALRAALAEYESSESPQCMIPSVAPSAHLKARKSPARKTSPEREKALEFAYAFVLSQGRKPVPTRIVFEAMERAGITIGGKSPMNNLSAILSNSDLFHSHGRAGWVVEDLRDDNDTSVEYVGDEPDDGHHTSDHDNSDQAGQLLARLP